MIGSVGGHRSLCSHNRCFLSTTLDAQWRWRYSGVRSFSTSRDGPDDDDPRVASASVQSKALEMASREARALSELASRSCSLEEETSDDSAPSTKNATDAMEAAQTLLAVTSPTKPLVDAINGNHPNSDDQVTSLHRAFLAVTLWCLSLVPADSSLLNLSLDVARRAGILALPLHLPLYEQLAKAVAQHSRESSCSAMIFEVSRWAGSMLLVPVHASFFNEPLVLLVKRQKIREAIILLNGIMARHDIDSLDYETTMQILEALGDYADVEEDADAMELFLILNRSVIRDLSMQDPKTSGKAELLDDSLAAPFGNDNSLEEIIELLRHLASDEEDKDGKLADMVESILASTGSVSDLKAAMVDLIQIFKGKLATRTPPSSTSVAEKDGVSKRVVQINPADGTMESLSFSVDDATDLSSESSDNEVHDLARDMIYTRDGSLWKLPDVTEQLIELNEGRDVLYTSEYEEKLLRNMAEEEEDGFEPSIDW